ncbi:MAG: cysteine--tRNA ligase [Myxococcaceae bacterium]|nr:cysteine--tRNA ligase [Myxococcaceae bacterium]MBH2005824.1 cysteine--tRNA ligase [Myxococcaceae bacterium]
MHLKLYNTLSRAIEPFKPNQAAKASLYTCGPTVYHYAHIGNLRTYVFEDVLSRTLQRFGFHVEHVMNITDVGHLESDSDVGDDKMELASKREKKSPWEVARYYERAFFQDTEALNILKPTIVCRATEHVAEMQHMIQKLISNGFAYVVEGNVYFRIHRFEDYSKLSRRNLEELMEGARVDIDSRKENPLDFVLWFSQSKYPNQVMKWESPWGVGFPGWHIECSAMALKYLGERIDIHCGGVDHISVHHTNEIAQTEGCLGHRWVNVWMHGEFLVLDKAKMSKSKGDFLTLSTLREQGFEAVHYRYFCLGAHYRSQLSFSYESLQASKNAFESLKNRVLGWRLEPKKGKAPEKKNSYQEAFKQALANDLDLPVAMRVLWDVVKDADLGTENQLELVEDFDQVFGLGVSQFERPVLSWELSQIVEERNQARAQKDWQKADELRQKLSTCGLQIKDTPKGPDWYFDFS